MLAAGAEAAVRRRRGPAGRALYRSLGFEERDTGSFRLYLALP
jgi:hypothetical protein